MKIISSQMMKKIDDFCINSLKIPGSVLMENAAIKVIKNIDFETFNSFAIVCGKGNNGGDGLAVARHLYVLGKKIKVFLVGSLDNMSEDCKINYNILKNIGIDIEKINNEEDIILLKEYINNSDATIDAIFGTGLCREVRGIYNSIISIINKNSNYIISIDIPSGLDSDTGKCLNSCIKAQKTISFELYKKGFFNYESDKFLGKVIIENIGIPNFVIDKFYDKEFIMDKDAIKSKIKIRSKYSHKGDYGRLLVVAGSKGFSGAAYITTEAAVKTGTGLVTLCCHKDIQNIVSSKLIEAMTISFEDDKRLMECIEKSNCIALGPGLGNNQITFKLLKKIILNSKCPIVIDADGINVIKRDINILSYKKNKIILTPHLGEMSRLVEKPIDYIRENRMEVAKSFAKKYNVIVLLKGHNTVITDGDFVIINSTGNSAMASGGMGDCLTGIIASFIAQGYEPMSATYIGAFVHGYCGDKLSKNMFCVSASDILNNLPISIKEVQNL